MEVSDKTAIGLYTGTGLVAVWQWFYYNPMIVAFIFFSLFAISIGLTFFE